MMTLSTVRTRSTVLASGLAVLLVAALSPWASPAEAAPNTCKKGFFPASGQTQTFTAEKNDGISGAVAVPDDGAIQAGQPLSYRDNGDGTITDLNTGLMWEKKGLANDLHGDLAFYWSGDGSQDTIWDWLTAVNAENGVGFAGYRDWRIANAKELQSIVKYGTVDPPAVASAFNNNCGDACTVLECSCTQPSFYWSSTGQTDSFAVAVDFDIGEVRSISKSSEFLPVRAVRGGCDN